MIGVRGKIRRWRDPNPVTSRIDKKAKGGKMYRRLRTLTAGWARAALILGILLGLALAPATSAAAAPPFPDLISLPDGFQPEGIVTGRGFTFYAGSLAGGAIYEGSLRTGEGSVLIQPQAGRIAVGLSYDSRSGYLFVAGGPTGQGYVYDTVTGDTVAVYQLNTLGTFVNDVIVTRSAAYFTDSNRAVFYKVPLSARGAVPDQSAVTEVPLTGDYQLVAGQFNANGIEATPNGDWLIIVNSFLGTLYKVDPGSGEASLIDLGSDNVASGDGILLDGKTLYVVQNFLNQIAVVQLKPDLSKGRVVEILTDPDFDVPTTVTDFGNALYAVNARFTTPPTPDTSYQVVRVGK